MDGNTLNVSDLSRKETYKQVTCVSMSVCLSRELPQLSIISPFILYVLCLHFFKKYLFASFP